MRALLYCVPDHCQPLTVETLVAHVQEFLRLRHIRLNTDLGQHFLVDEFVLEDIVDSAEIKETDHIVEIGPGIGVLTAELLARAKTVTAIELDQRMLPLLQTYVKDACGTTEGLTIIQGNALHVPLPKTPYKVVANIPYHITSPLLRHLFLESEVQPTSLTLLIQKEVAETICDAENAGILTIVVGLFGTPRIVCKVPAASFLPPPKVESAVLHIDSFAAPLADAQTIDEILRLTKVGFGQKRKMLRNSLGSLPDGPARMAKAGIDLTRRPQTLSVREWIALAKAV